MRTKSKLTSTHLMEQQRNLKETTNLKNNFQNTSQHAYQKRDMQIRFPRSTNIPRMCFSTQFRFPDLLPFSRRLVLHLHSKGNSWLGTDETRILL